MQSTEMLSQNVVNCLTDLALTVHPRKSGFNPTQCIQFLGFQLDSCLMLVPLTSTKADKIRVACKTLAKKQAFAARQLAQVTGSLVAVHAGMCFAPSVSKDRKLLKRQLWPLRMGILMVKWKSRPR